MASLKLLSLNVSGLRNKTKRKTLFRQFKQKKFDVVCVQESHVTKEVIESWRKEWGGEIVYYEGTNHSKGQLILLRNNFPYEYSIEKQSARILAIRIKDQSKETAIFNIYAPNSSPEIGDFFHELTETVEEVNVPRKIICGDFNCVLNNNLDIISGDPHQENLVKKFNDFVDTCALTDIWRLFNPESKEHSWSRKRINTLIARRLDYILSTDNVIDDSLECNMTSFSSSDHRGVILEIKSHDQKRGPGYWKVNNALLRDKLFVDKINLLIDNFLNDNHETNADIKWELLKLKLKSETIQYSKSKAAKNRSNKALWQAEFDRFDSLLAKDPENVELLKNREDTRFKLELLEREEASSAQTRSKIKWIEEGEKNTKYFLNLEKSRANAKLFPKLEIEDKVIVDQFEILTAQKEHFAKIYDTEKKITEGELDTFLQGCEMPQLSPEQKQECEGLISVPEATQALKSMKNGSSPGLDGLSTEFLKFFWAKLKNTIVDSFNFAYGKGQLSHTQSSAVITLIHKGKELSKSSLNNWRPISLTNSDYKLLAKCLAARVCKVITSIVSEDQVGYVKGRNVSSILRLIDDVIEHTRLTENPGLILALDFQKAFDSVSKDYIIQSFKCFGFGSSFLKWVNTLFEKSKSCITYNGWLSEDFDVMCGVRQGCPFSPLAFIIGIELMAIKFRQSEHIKGIKIDASRDDSNLMKAIKILLYADDVTLLLRDRNDIPLVLQILDAYSKISGLVINRNKSQAMWIGSSRNKTKQCYDLQWKNEIKILGINFCSNYSASQLESNWVSRIKTIKQLIQGWEKRNLGLLGKICVIKAFLLSQLVYVMQAISIPEKILNELNTLFFRFLWRKKNCNK